LAAVWEGHPDIRETVVVGDMQDLSDKPDWSGIPVQDPEKRATLLSAIGESRLKELLALVPDEILKVIAVMDGIEKVDAPLEPDALEKLYREAHGLKGVAVNYGLVRLAKVSAAVQDYCRTRGDIDLLRRKLQECSGELVILMDQ